MKIGVKWGFKLLPGDWKEPNEHLDIKTTPSTRVRGHIEFNPIYFMKDSLPKRLKLLIVNFSTSDSIFRCSSEYGLSSPSPKVLR